MNLHAASPKEPILEAVFWLFVLVCLAAVAVGWSKGWIFLGVVGLVALGILLYGGFVEPVLVRATTYRLGEGKKTFRIVFISDLHAGLRKRPAFYQGIAKRVLALEPDLAILGGDLVNERAKDVTDLSAILEMKLPLGMWFLLGNHDFFDDPKGLVKKVTEYGARNLTNQALTFKLGEASSLEIVGLDDSWYGSPDMSLIEKPKKGPRIVVTHEPDLLLDLPENCADMILLGHTHGGQIRLPGYGPLLGLPQSAPQSYDAGEKVWKNMRVIISRGIAETLVRARLGSRPEIVVIDVHTEDSPARHVAENSLA